VPFRYEFEGDGDLDVFVNGNAYDFDSPFDIESKKNYAFTGTFAR
jgi:hypothetical protein